MHGVIRRRATFAQCERSAPAPRNHALHPRRGVHHRGHQRCDLRSARCVAVTCDPQSPSGFRAVDRGKHRLPPARVRDSGRHRRCRRRMRHRRARRGADVGAVLSDRNRWQGRHPGDGRIHPAVPGSGRRGRRRSVGHRDRRRIASRQHPGPVLLCGVHHRRALAVLRVRPAARRHRATGCATDAPGRPDRVIGGRASPRPRVGHHHGGCRRGRRRHLRVGSADQPRRHRRDAGRATERLPLYVSVSGSNELPTGPVLAPEVQAAASQVPGVAEVVPLQFAYGTIGDQRILLGGTVPGAVTL